MEKTLTQSEILDFFKTRMLNTYSASNYLNLSIPYLRRLATKGKIVSYKPTGKNLYFDIEDLDNYLRTFRRMSENEIKIHIMRSKVRNFATSF